MRIDFIKPLYWNVSASSYFCGEADALERCMAASSNPRGARNILNGDHMSHKIRFLFVCLLLCHTGFGQGPAAIGQKQVVHSAIFRILSGHSAAGQFALYALTSEPSLFNAYFAICPSLDWDNNLPQRSLEDSFTHTDSLKAFLYFAWSDDFNQALADDQRLLITLETKAPKRFRWVGKGFPDETHISAPLLAQIDALRQLYAGYRFHNDFLGRGYEFAEKKFQKLSDEVGYTIAVPEDVINNFAYEELSKGNIQKAIGFFKRNIMQNPNSANAYDGIADAYEKAGMGNDAIVSLENAVELAKKYDDPNLNYFIDHLKKVKAKGSLKSEK
jgi:uncharacterized protein